MDLPWKPHFAFDGVSNPENYKEMRRVKIVIEALKLTTHDGEVLYRVPCSELGVCAGIHPNEFVEELEDK